MKKRSSEKKKINSDRRRLVEELYATARRNFPRRCVIVRGYDDLWQTDIVEMRLYLSFIRNHHYILAVIDVLSMLRKPYRSRARVETTDAIAEIIRANGREIYKRIRKEFYNADMQKISKKHDINHYSMYLTLKVSVVEWFNRTLRNDMWKMLHSTAITSGSTSCCVSCQIITCASIGLSTRRRNSRNLRKTLEHSTER